VTLILYVAKYRVVNLTRLNADLDEFVVAKMSPSEFAWRTTSSPYRDKHVKHLVKAVKFGYIKRGRYLRTKSYLSGSEVRSQLGEA